MGTRADFYIGRGKAAEWIGSIPFDGHPSGIPDHILRSRGEAAFRKLLADWFPDQRASLPSDGWPWPWDDSRTTDYAYALDGKKVWCSRFGSEWFDPLKEEPDDPPKGAVFPDMKAVKNVTLGPRSGLIVIAPPAQKAK